MAIQMHGQLAGFHVPELLGFLNLNRKSGVLEVSNGTHAAGIFFDLGEVVWARTNDARLRLGALLLRTRQIDREQYARVESVMLLRDGLKFGAAAVEQGVFSDDALQDALKTQVAEIVFDCYPWTEGTFTFNDSLRLPGHAVTIAVEICNLIMEGARRIDEWQECQQLFPDDGVVLRRSPHPEIPSDFTLSREEWELLSHVDGHTPLRDLAPSGSDPLETYRLLYGLLASRLIEIGAAPSGEDEAVAEAPPRRDDTDLLISREATLSFRRRSDETVGFLVPVEEGRAHTLTEQEYRIGRRPDNEVHIVDLSVSAHHARIFRSADGWMIEDLSSRNGTFVNDEPIEATALKHADRVRFGDAMYMFNIVSYASMAKSVG